MSTARVVGSRSAPRTVGKPVSSSTGRAASKPAKDVRREACADELQFKALDAIRSDLQTAVLRETEKLVQLERSVLDFHYAHSICYQPSDQPLTAPVSTVTSSPTSRNGTATSSSSTSLVANPRTAYYLQSEISQLRRGQQVQLHQQADAVVRVTAKIERMERDVEDTIVKGSLAAQRAIVQGKESELLIVQHAVEEEKATATQLRAAIAAEKAGLERMAQDHVSCEQRKGVLEEKKRKQMENVESTRQELQACRDEVQAAQKELKRREKVVRELRQEIERRKERLKRRKVEN